MGKYALFTSPKAGSQWIRDVVFDPEIIAVTPGLHFSPPTGSEQLAEWHSRADGACTGPIYNVRRALYATYERPEYFAVIVRRDPRDVLVSWVFSMLYSHSAVAAPVHCFREVLNCISMRQRLMVGIMHETGMASALTWMDPNETHAPNVLTTTFEEIVRDPAAGFGKIFETFRWAVPPEIASSVIARHRFQLRSGGRNPGETNEHSHYRRGIAGDWKNYFDRDLGALFEFCHPGGLVKTGYEQSNDWFEALPAAVDALEHDDGGISGTSASVVAELEALRERNAVLEQSYSAQRALLDEYSRLMERAAG